MSRLTHDDVEESYARVLRLAEELGIDTTDWALVPGELGNSGARRTPYRIARNDQRLMVLGYTRRTAVDALIAVATAYEVALSAGAA